MFTDARAQFTELRAKLFRGFGDTSRLSILEALGVRSLTVGEIVKATGLSQPNVSNHLACLRECGLVVSEHNWRHVTYRLSDDRVGELLELATSLLSDVTRGVYECTRHSLPKAEGQESE